MLDLLREYDLYARAHDNLVAAIHRVLVAPMSPQDKIELVQAELHAVENIVRVHAMIEGRHFTSVAARNDKLRAKQFDRRRRAGIPISGSAQHRMESLGNTNRGIIDAQYAREMGGQAITESDVARFRHPEDVALAVAVEAARVADKSAAKAATRGDDAADGADAPKPVAQWTQEELEREAMRGVIASVDDLL